MKRAGFVLAAALAVACSDSPPTAPAPSSAPAPAPAPAPPPPPEPEPEPVRLAWPVAGERGADWVISNYVDLDPGSGVLDYRGGSFTYDGHRGTDVDSPNFRWMDRDAPHVLAAAAGEVTARHDGEPDRNVLALDVNPLCDGVRNNGNFLELTHADGSRTIYKHLKTGSVAAAMGAAVEAGTVLGVVGSSGCSTAPHLHFEVWSPDGDLVDPFRDGTWAEAPAYDAPFGLLDSAVIGGRFASPGALLDPPPNVEAVEIGEWVSAAVYVTQNAPGDTVGVVLAGSGGPVEEFSHTIAEAHSRSRWYWEWRARRGVSAVEILLNGEPVAVHRLSVPPAPSLFPDTDPAWLRRLATDYPHAHQDANVRVFSDIGPDFSREHAAHLRRVWNFFDALYAENRGPTSISTTRQIPRSSRR